MMKKKTKSELKREEVMKDDEVKDAASEGLSVPEADMASSEWKGEGNPVDGQMVTLGTVVYRFMTKMEKAYDVQIGADATESLANLKKAVDQTGESGLHYFEGTRGQSLVPLEITL